MEKRRDLGPLEDFIAAMRSRMERDAADVKPWHSFWYHRPAKRFPPATTERPDQYDGSDRLAVSCTQSDLPAREQRSLVSQWCKTLPRLERVEFLWFHSKVLPEMFEAACRMPNLVGLCINWSSVQSLEPLGDHSGLRYLRIGSSPGIVSLEPLARLLQLRWLELADLKRVTDIDDLESLRRLIGFSFDGPGGSAYAVPSWKPLENMTELAWLKLGAVRSADGSLRSLAKLKQLKWLGLARDYDMKEFAWLASQLPKTECAWLHPFDTLAWEKCRRCKTAQMVMLSGKGKPCLCPKCDASKLAKHVQEFELLVRRGQRDG